jgi:hypothetical protein
MEAAGLVEVRYERLTWGAAHLHVGIVAGGGRETGIEKGD